MATQVFRKLYALQRFRKIVCASEVADLSRLAEVANRAHEVQNSANMAAIEHGKQLAQFEVIRKGLDAIPSELKQKGSLFNNCALPSHRSPSFNLLSFFPTHFGSQARKWAPKFKSPEN